MNSLGAVEVGPLVDQPAGKLGAVVAAKGSRFTALPNQAVEDFGNLVGKADFLVRVSLPLHGSLSSWA